MDGQSVSIHAPAEGATGPYASRISAARVSIHAPAEGATQHSTSGRPGPRSFNPRARGGRDSCRRYPPTCRERFNPRARGGRDGLLALSETAATVSIHAPAEGATSGRPSLTPSGTSFNPRARGGRDAPGHCPYRRGNGFNPRARGGRDSFQPSTAPSHEAFQSTRPRRARPLC